MTQKKVILRLLQVLEILGLGVLEWWRIGVLEKIRHQSFRHDSNTPVLQYFEIICNLKLPRRIHFFWVIDPKIFFLNFERNIVQVQNSCHTVVSGSEKYANQNYFCRVQIVIHIQRPDFSNRLPVILGRNGSNFEYPLILVQDVERIFLPSC